MNQNVTTTWRGALRALRGPGAAVLVVFAAIAAIGLPAIAELALAAAPRAVADLGGLGVRIASLAVAVAAGHSAVGPLLRREGSAAAGHGWAWAVARTAGALAATGVVAATMIGVWTTISVLLGTGVPPSLGPWAAGLALQLLVVVTLAAALGAALRGAVGPSLVVGVIVLGQLRRGWAELDPGSPAALVARVVGVLVPDLSRLDHHAALLGATPPGGATLLLGALHATLWAGAAVCALVLAVKLRR